jgi:hypothetical protein
MGGHAVAGASQARVWLEREVSVPAVEMEAPVSDPLSANGQIVRVNLRPYVAGGSNLEVLLEGFIAQKYRNQSVSSVRC